MKKSQWTIAAVVLAATVFSVTFAMNFLGEGGRRSRTSTPGKPQREVRFFWQVSPPPGGHGVVEFEAHAPGHQDFWFCNDNTEPIKVGLKSKSCKCASVELFLLPEDGSRRLAADAVALVGTAATGQRLYPWLLQALAMPEVQKSAGAATRLHDATDSISVPGGAVGWVRMRWDGERVGRQILSAELWMDEPDAGAKVLETRLLVEDPVRVQSTLALGTLRDDALGVNGLTRHIICWSSTRPSLRLEAKAVQVRADPSLDPFTVGQPQAMSASEIRELEKENNREKSPTVQETEGRVLCAYRIPVTLRGYGKAPVDLGPFNRRVTVACPDAPGEPKQVAVTGRIRGDIEIGNDENGEINFSIFPARTGKREKIAVQSDAPGLKLTFDRERTPKFLNAVLAAPEKDAGGRQVWTLRAEVLPGQASGIFPRREDPRYEDSAIYLKADVMGKPPRSVRIAVQGIANQL